MTKIPGFSIARSWEEHFPGKDVHSAAPDAGEVPPVEGESVGASADRSCWPASFITNPAYMAEQAAKNREVRERLDAVRVEDQSDIGDSVGGHR